MSAKRTTSLKNICIRRNNCEFCQRVGLPQGVTPRNEDSRKSSERLIETRLLVDPRGPLRMLGPPVLVQLTKPDLCTLKKHQASSSEEDCSYLANLVRHALQDELSTFVRYTRCTSVALAIGGAVGWDAFPFDQQHKEKQWIQRKIFAS